MNRGVEVVGLRRLGKILHFSRSQSLVVRLESPNPPKIGTKIFDSKLREVGYLYDVFGSTSKPYVTVKSSGENPSSYIGRIVYAVKEEA